MQAGANSIRRGNILEYQGKLWKVAKQPMHTQPGKGGAFVQVELKDIKTGTKLNERFRSDESVEKVRLDQKEYQFLYHTDSKLTLMDLETFEQLDVDDSLLEERVAFLKDGMMVWLESYNEMPISLSLPETVILEVAEAEPVVKGQTVTSSYKPAIMENGVKVMVPPFISAGDRLVVRTEDSTYVERASNN